MGDYEGNAAWIAAVSGRADIELYSIFSLEIKEVSEGRIGLSRSMSSMIAYSIDSKHNHYLGWPLGEVWDAVKKIEFTGFKVEPTPLSLSSSHELQLHYEVETEVIVSERSRRGVHNMTKSENRQLHMCLPVTASVGNKLETASLITLVPYDGNHESDDADAIVVTPID
ncbi:TPA: hypothetical protein ACN38J_003671 [Vibrio parahaemolyticus]